MPPIWAKWNHLRAAGVKDPRLSLRSLCRISDTCELALSTTLVYRLQGYGLSGVDLSLPQGECKHFKWLLKMTGIE